MKTSNRRDELAMREMREQLDAKTYIVLSNGSGRDTNRLQLT